MKLYKVPPKSWIIYENESIFFDHLDGMYSYCKTKDGSVIHLAAWTPVTIDKTKEIC